MSRATLNQFIWFCGVLAGALVANGLERFEAQPVIATVFIIAGVVVAVVTFAVADRNADEARR